MKCPYCAHLGDKVVDSRESKEGEAIRRRRECLECGKRFTSYERIDEIAYMVVKKDGRPIEGHHTSDCFGNGAEQGVPG